MVEDLCLTINALSLMFIVQSDSNGEATIASRYTQWYSDVLLRRVSAGHICFSNTLRYSSCTVVGSLSAITVSVSTCGPIASF